MPRTAQPRIPTAGEVVSYFEDLPVEMAKTVLEIVSTRVAIRIIDREAKNPFRGVVGTDSAPKKKVGRPKKTNASEEQTSA